MTACEMTTSPCAVYNDVKVFVLRTVNACRHAGDRGELRSDTAATTRKMSPLWPLKAVSATVTCWLSRRE